MQATQAPTRVHRQVFTLTELMVVMGVLLILAGIALAAISRARVKARQSECISQLRQIGTAVHMYANDYDDCLPLAARLGDEPAYKLPSLPQSLQAYCREPLLFRCPADRGPDSLYDDFGTSYEWNTFLSGKQLDRTTLNLVGLKIHAPMAGDGEPFHAGKNRNFLWPDGHVETSLEILIQ